MLPSAHVTSTSISFVHATGTYTRYASHSRTQCTETYCCKCCYFASRPTIKVYHGRAADDKKIACLSISAFGTVANNPRHRLDRLPWSLRQSFAGYPKHPTRIVSEERWIQQGSPASRFFFLTRGLLRSVRCPQNRDPAQTIHDHRDCLLYTSPSPRDLSTSRMPSSA